jgi:hypothetical protein
MSCVPIVARLDAKRKQSDAHITIAADHIASDTKLFSHECEEMFLQNILG